MIDFKNKYVFIYEIAQKESRLLMTKRLLLTGPRHRSRERERQKKKKKKKKTDWAVESMWVGGESSRRGVWSQ